MRPPHHEFFQFQFTHPGRGATGNVGKAIKLLFVSIHAPREGCDCVLAVATVATTSFNSRTPGGVRLAAAAARLAALRVSIHAPREGCDQDTTKTIQINKTFQFTHPGRGATWTADGKEDLFVFQFTHPGRGATHREELNYKNQDSFNSRTPGGVRPTSQHGHYPARCFNSRTPGGVRHTCAEELFKQHLSFNSRTPGGVRRVPSLDLFGIIKFQFTHPGRGATYPIQTIADDRARFNSRTPGGVRQ